MEFRKNRSSSVVKPAVCVVIGLILGAWIAVVYVQQQKAEGLDGAKSAQQQLNEENQAKVDAFISEMRRTQQDMGTKLSELSQDQKTLLLRPAPAPVQCPPPPPPPGPVFCPVPAPSPAPPPPSPPPALVSNVKTGALGRILTQKIFRDESICLVRVDERKFPKLQTPNVERPGFWMVQKGALDDILTFLINNEHHMITEYDRILLQSPCYPGVPATGHNKCVMNHPIYKNKLNGRRPVVLDVGSNSGFFSLLSASYGYEAIAFEPQNHCALYLSASACMSGMDDRISINNMFVGNQFNPGRKIPQRTGCWGTFPYNDPGQDQRAADMYADVPEAQVPISIPTKTLDSQFDPAETLILLMKVDTEGHEKEVFEGARKLFEARAILNVLVEVGKRQLSMSGISHDESRASLRWLMSLGYKIKLSNYGSYESQQPLEASHLETLYTEGWNVIDMLIYLPDDAVY